MSVMSDIELLKRLGLYKRIYDNYQNKERLLRKIKKINPRRGGAFLGPRLAYFLNDLIIWRTTLEGSDFWRSWHDRLSRASDEEIYKLFTFSIKYNKDLK